MVPSPNAVSQSSSVRFSNLPAAGPMVFTRMFSDPHLASIAGERRCRSGRARARRPTSRSPLRPCSLATPPSRRAQPGRGRAPRRSRPLRRGSRRWLGPCPSWPPVTAAVAPFKPRSICLSPFRSEIRLSCRGVSGANRRLTPARRPSMTFAALLGSHPSRWSRAGCRRCSRAGPPASRAPGGSRRAAT